MNSGREAARSLQSQAADCSQPRRRVDPINEGCAALRLSEIFVKLENNIWIHIDSRTFKRYE